MAAALVEHLLRNFEHWQNIFHKIVTPQPTLVEIKKDLLQEYSKRHSPPV